jgi:hypothetical protein
MLRNKVYCILAKGHEHILSFLTFLTRRISALFLWYVFLPNKITLSAKSRSRCVSFFLIFLDLPNDKIEKLWQWNIPLFQIILNRKYCHSIKHLSIYMDFTAGFTQTHFNYSQFSGKNKFNQNTVWYSNCQTLCDASSALQWMWCLVCSLLLTWCKPLWLLSAHAEEPAQHSIT